MATVQNTREAGIGIGTGGVVYFVPGAKIVSERTVFGVAEIDSAVLASARKDPANEALFSEGVLVVSGGAPAAEAAATKTEARARG